jgi:hypothetical protein
VALLADRRWRAVARVYDCLGRNRKQHLVDAVHQAIGIATGQIETPNALLVQCVASENDPGSRCVKTNVTRCMTRRMENLDFQLTHLEHLTVL